MPTFNYISMYYKITQFNKYFDCQKPGVSPSSCDHFDIHYHHHDHHDHHHDQHHDLQVVHLLVLAGAHLGLSSGELGLLFTSAAGQVLVLQLVLQVSLYLCILYFCISICILDRLCHTGQGAGVEGSFSCRSGGRHCKSSQWQHRLSCVPSVSTFINVKFQQKGGNLITISIYI